MWRETGNEKYELWAFREGCAMAELNEILDEWNYVYDYVRPHQSLGFLAPMEFYRQWKGEGGVGAYVSTM